jgi:hypothetical protein
MITSKMNAILKLGVILKWTNGFTGDTSTLKTKDIYEVLNSSITLDERKTLTTADLSNLFKEFAHFDYVVPFLFFNHVVASSRYKCGYSHCNAVLDQQNMRSSSHSNNYVKAIHDL